MIVVPEGRHSIASTDAVRVKVDRVFDGDGFLASAWNPYREAWVARIPFRLAFIDAPELAQPFGPESKDFLRALIAGKSLDIVPVLKGSVTPTFIDPHRRVLCVPFLTEMMGAGRIEYYRNGRCATGSMARAREITRNVELEMVVNGWAWVVDRYAFDHEAEYLAAQDDARRNRRGLWLTDHPEPPWDFKRRRKRMNERPSKDRLL